MRREGWLLVGKHGSTGTSPAVAAGQSRKLFFGRSSGIFSTLHSHSGENKAATVGRASSPSFGNNGGLVETTQVSNSLVRLS
jgi:hypothetical protein